MIDLRIYCPEGGRPESLLKQFDGQGIFGSTLAIQYIRPRIISPKSDFTVMGFTDDLFLKSLDHFLTKNQTTSEQTFFKSLIEVFDGYDERFNAAVEITRDLDGMICFYKIIGIDLTAKNLERYFEAIARLIPPLLHSTKYPTDLILTVLAEINIDDQKLETIRCQDGESLDIYLFDDRTHTWQIEAN